MSRRPNDFPVSANLAYGEVMLESVYQEPDKVVKGRYELTEYPAIKDGPPAAPVYDTVRGRRAE